MVVFSYDSRNLDALHKDIGMIHKRSLLASSILSFLTTITVVGCNNSSSTNNSEKDAYFDTTNPPKIVLNLPHNTGPIAKLPISGSIEEPVVANDNEAVIYLVTKPNQALTKNFNQYSLHIWNNNQCDRADESAVNGAWDNSQNKPIGIDKYGPYWKVKLKPGSTNCLNVIVRDDQLNNQLSGDGKVDFALIPDRTASFVAGSNEPKNSREAAFIAISGIEGAKAHLIDGETLIWDGIQSANEVRLYVSLGASVEPNNNYQYDEPYIVLKPKALTLEQMQTFPHLATMSAYSIPSTIDMRSVVKAEMVALAVDKEGNITAGTKVQPAGLLDSLFATYAEAKTLGAEVTADGVQFGLWAPSAQNVVLVLFDDDKKERGRLQMTLDGQSGIWSLKTNKAQDGSYYRYLIDVFHPVSGNIEKYQVTDPYALSLSMNSLFSQVVDLDDQQLKPDGWDELQRPIPQSNPTKFVIYESHVRDFSGLDQSTPEAFRGKFKAFTETDSVPVKHLKQLSKNGITHLHLLPIFDIATINEAPTKVADINMPFSQLCEVNSEVTTSSFSGDCLSSLTIAEILARETENDTPKTPRVQELNRLVSATDSFNWGYDPFHYTVPEGSYSTNSDGKQRILELREMVQAIKKDIKMNVVMDVVYNHTNSAGPTSDTSVLDKIVPWYYNRLNPQTGAVENSTCCSNTAPEHTMMAKLIQDSLVVWARDYKIDAFRFDLMGHHPLSQIKASLKAVQAVDPDVYFYGEGWNFGEVANDRLFVQATQTNLAGTGIGSFSDRLRDSVRGGGPFDGGDGLRQHQGFGNGAFVQPNEMSLTTKDTALHLADLTRLGMAGNLKDFQFIDAKGNKIRGSELDYNGQPAGYAKDPTEIQNYVSKHDNQTLWDNQQYKIGYDVDMQTRVRMQAVSLATAMLGQGVPFTHMGSELLRSKSMQRDSYDSGDWYNRVDFTLQDNNWNKGLPRVDKDGMNYEIIQQVIQGSGVNAQPSRADMNVMVDYYLDLVKLRQSYPLLTLGRGDDVIKRVSFHNTGVDQRPGLIVMTIDNGNTVNDLDPNVDAMVIVINATPRQQKVDLGLSGLLLSPVYRSNLAHNTQVIDNEISVPAWTPAVLVKPRHHIRSEGIPVFMN